MEKSKTERFENILFLLSPLCNTRKYCNKKNFRLPAFEEFKRFRGREIQKNIYLENVRVHICVIFVSLNIV